MEPSRLTEKPLKSRTSMPPKALIRYLACRFKYCAASKPPFAVPQGWRSPSDTSNW